MRARKKTISAACEQVVVDESVEQNVILHDVIAERHHDRPLQLAVALIAMKQP